MWCTDMWANESKDNQTQKSEEDVKESCLHRESDLDLVCQIVFLLTAFFSVRFKSEEGEHGQ